MPKTQQPLPGQQPTGDNLGTWMVAVRMSDKPGTTTCRWAIHSKGDNALLGTVSWYGGWRFAHERNRRTIRLWRITPPTPPPFHFNCRCRLSERIKLINSTSVKVSEQMREAGAVVHAAFSNLAKAMSQVKIPPLHVPQIPRCATVLAPPIDASLVAGTTNFNTDPPGVPS